MRTKIETPSIRGAAVVFPRRSSPLPWAGAGAALLLLLLAALTALQGGATPPPPGSSEFPPQGGDDTVQVNRTRTGGRTGARGGGVTGAPATRPPGGRDTSAVGSKDTSYVVVLDSSARMRQWVHVRRDRPSARFFPDRVYPLYAAPRSPGLRREFAFDSTGGGVTMRESLGGSDVRLPSTLGLQDYVAERRRAEMRTMLADEARKAPELRARDDVGDLLANITQIQIPVPANPIFSIFGKSEIRLNISGSVDIKAGFRNITSDQTTLSFQDQSRNEPDFSQEVQVNVNGKIGDKLDILADWNTRRTFEYENQLKIKYTGYDDEIVRSVEAGNVSLSTPSTFVGSSQALFGVKAQFQTGPLTLTALASQKKGQIKEVSVSGGAQQIPFNIEVVNYSTNHFFVDTSYRSSYEPYFSTPNGRPQVDPTRQIVEAEVWVQRIGTNYDRTERQANGLIDLGQRPPGGYDPALQEVQTDDGRVETGLLYPLKPSEFELLGEGYPGILSLNLNVQDAQIVAIAYRTADGGQVGDFVRDDTSTTRKLILKLLKPKNLNAIGPRYEAAWNQLVKSIYPLGSRNVKEAGFELDIFRRVEGGVEQNTLQGEPLIRAVGLDELSVDGTPNPDNKFDFRPNITINLARAEIIFPSLRPFDAALRDYFQEKGNPLTDSNLVFPEVYDSTKTQAQKVQVRNKYLVKGSAQGEATSKYNLGFNVVEGSVQVLLDGTPLVPNRDYTVDYIIGEVVIRESRALVPGANVQIRYEQNDLFQLASKTLLGARGDVVLGRNTAFGFTVMNLNQQSLSDKVRLGEEPNINTIFGIDGGTSVDLPFLTRALDALPLIQTREASQLRVSGEAAYMLPDPNARKSTIPSDNSEGVAYIDDFEGARRTIPLGIQYGGWYPASPPADSLFGIRDTAKMFAKAKTVWFNRVPTDVALTDVYPEKVVGSAANNQITVLDLQYYPLTRGTFNYGLNVRPGDPGSTLGPDRNWGGVMKPISISGTNLVTENINYIEIWMQVGRAPADARILIDLGSISEDAIPDGRSSPNSEDLVLGPDPNGTLQEGEDIGLDMLTDDQERQRYADLIAAYPELGADPSGDNYSYDNRDNNTVREDFGRINGSENSRNGPVGIIPDTEDLNNNGVTDKNNSFFRYVVPLDTSALRNPFIVGGGGVQGWYQFRIPIRQADSQIGTPTLENIESLRLAFVNVRDTVAIRIADIALVGNQWEELRTAANDSVFAVTVVSVEENPGVYTSPPGVVRERDKTRPDEEVLANEQSLAVKLFGLPDGQSRQARKFYSYRPLDVFNYRVMKMFVYGDAAFRYVDSTDYDVEAFFRFGADSLNYYEYRVPVRPGWDPLNEMVVDFAELTAIKQGRDSANILSPPVPVAGRPGATYRVLGNPSLTALRYLAVGADNPAGRGTPGAPVQGDVWFNELRLISVDDTPGWAYRIDTQLKLADFATVAFNYSRVDPFFHRLEERFGTRVSGTGWALSVAANLEKLFPTSWAGTSIPVSYSHTDNLQQPRYLPNSDVLVEEAVARARTPEEGEQIRYEAETYRISDTWAAPTFRVGLPVDDWWIRDTFNKLSYGFTYTRSEERSPAVVFRTSWSWSASIRYALTLPPDYFIQPFRSLFDGVFLLDAYKDLRIFFPLTGFNWGVGFNRARDVSLMRSVNAQELTTRAFTSNRSLGFGWRLTENGFLNPSGDYSVTVESSLLSLETDPTGAQRSFSEILGDIFGGDQLIDFGDDTRFLQRNTFNTRPVLPDIFGLRKYLDLSFGYSVDYAWQNTLQAGDIGKSAGWNNSLNFSTNFRMKALFDPLFEDGPYTVAPPPPERGRRGGEQPARVGTDSAATIAQDTLGVANVPAPAGPGLGGQLKNLLRVLIKVPFLDYENVNVTFTQTNSAQNSGVVGRTGFGNFWAVPFIQDQDPQRGPSRLYQLGLMSDPHGEPANVRFTLLPPFLRWDVDPGVRAAPVLGPNGQLIQANLTDIYRQTNRVGLKTTRPLWEGARLDLNWSLGWGYNRTRTFTTDQSGTPLFNSPTAITTTGGNIDRSFLTFPDVLIFGLFNTSVGEVSKRYGELVRDGDSTRSNDEKLAQAFQEGLEALPWLSTIFGEYYPRVNWSLRWDGLEKIPLLAGFVQRLSLDHTYTGNFTRSFRDVPGVAEQKTDAERASYGFTPLVGLNFTFKELWKGAFGAAMRYSSSVGYDLQLTTKSIVETETREVSVSLSYTRRGFEIPLFGLALNNDVDLTATYSVAKNSRVSYDLSRPGVEPQGVPQDGTTRTTLEPRIKYVLSQRMTASVYYRYTSVQPDASGSRIPGTTTNEAGLDLRISIQ
jgi:hypothetical protein